MPTYVYGIVTHRI